MHTHCRGYTASTAVDTSCIDCVDYLRMSTVWTCAVTTDTDQWYFQLMPPSEQQKHKRACLKNDKKMLSGIRHFGGISTSDSGCVIVQGLK